MIAEAANDESAEARVVRLLTQRGLTVAVAESCTGGLIGHLLTNVPGSSRCFIGAVAAYHGRAKVALLGIPEETLRAHGGVSEETARAMAESIRERLGSDIGLGVTGIAGPGGGSGSKPVGLVHLALVDAEGRRVARREVWSGDRESNKAASAGAALEMVASHVRELYPIR
jgi:nicotinamide-nucleotide amidase